MSAVPDLAIPAPGGGRPHSAPGCAQPQQETRRPYSGRGGAFSGLGAGSPGRPAGGGDAELTNGLPEAERGNRHPRGLERPGTAGAARPVLQQLTPEGLWRWTPDAGERRLPRTGNPARARPGRRGHGSRRPGRGEPAAASGADKVVPSGAAVQLCFPI